MPKTRGRPAKKKGTTSAEKNENEFHEPIAEKNETEVQEPVAEKNETEVQAPIAEKNETEFHDPELNRQIAAIRALRDVQIEQLRTKLQLLRSHIHEERDVPVLQFFKEKCPNLEIFKNEKDSHYDVREKNDQGNICMNQAEGGDLPVSLLHHLSMIYPDLTTAEASHGGLEFSNKSVKTGYFGVDNLQIRAFDLGEQSEAPSFEWQDKFQTPDVSNQRLSIGVTPKTKRLPKHGEVLLSVRGSPLGVFKEDNMEAIDEVEDD